MKKKRLYKKKSLKKITITTIVIIVLISCLFLWLFTANSALINSVEVNSNALVNKAINSAITDVLTNKIAYDTLISVERDNEGNITMINANFHQINALSRDFAKKTEEKIEDFGVSGIAIPIGTFSGINILIGRGPAITAMVKPVGAVSCNFLTQFESAGINQTNHKIFLQISVDVGVVMPLSTYTFSTKQNIILSESVLIGKVPQMYLNYTKPSPLLNLTP